MLPLDERMPLARWRRNRTNQIRATLFRRYRLLPICCLALSWAFLQTDLYARIYLSLAQRFHWDMSGTSWPNYNLSDSDFSHMSFRGAFLMDGTFEYTDFTGSDLRGVLLSRSWYNARLMGANFSGCRLSQARMMECDLEFAQFRDADLTDAYLHSSRLKSANFSHANLKGVNLEDTDLRGANLEYANLKGASLQGANVSGAHYNKCTIWPDDFHPQKHPHLLNVASNPVTHLNSLSSDPPRQ